MHLEVKTHTVEGRAGQIGVRDYVPSAPTTDRPILWVHGGGFASGGLDQRESDAPARAWAQAGRRVRTVDYRLAPPLNLLGSTRLRPGENRFPAALHDVIDVITALTSEANCRIDLAGASAGANLAVAAALVLRSAPPAMPRRLALAYGTFHAAPIPGSDVYAKLRGPIARWAFNPAMLRRMNLNYVGDPDLLVPGLAFPGNSDLTGLPPTLILDAENDRLHASGRSFAAELRGAGVEVEEKSVDALHGFLDRPRSDAFAVGVAGIGDWLA